MSEPEGTIEHEGGERNGAFFIVREGRRIGELTYYMMGDTAVVGHTWVDPSRRGGGEARRLIDAAVDWARRERRRISPVCSYVRLVMDRAPQQYQDVRAA